MAVKTVSKYGVTDEMIMIIDREIETHFMKAAPEHGLKHARSVRRIASQILDDGADTNLCAVISLLHDADDYKQFPDSNGGVPNALRIMCAAGVPKKARMLVVDDLLQFGYAKRLKGLAPKTPEGKATSDADMLDIMGASGIVRLAYYDALIGEPFFNPDEMPNPDVNFESYKACPRESAVRHMFDKILRLPRYMLTEKGHAESLLRRETCARFLSDLFREQGRSDWSDRLEAFMAEELKLENLA